MTELADKTEAGQTITIGEKTYPVAELSEQVREMLSLHQQASEMAMGAKRQATIHDIAVHNLAAMIEKAVTDADE